MWCVSKHTFVRPCRSFVHFILNWPIVNFCGQFCWVLKNFTDFRLQSRDDWYWLAMAAGLRDAQKYIKLILLSTRRYNCVEALLPPWSRRRLCMSSISLFCFSLLEYEALWQSFEMDVFLLLPVFQPINLPPIIPVHLDDEGSVCGLILFHWVMCFRWALQHKVDANESD